MGNYLDRVIWRVVLLDLKYRLYWTAYEEDDLDSLKYKLYVFDNNGQTIQLIGYLVDTEIYEQPPIYNKQWCAAMCPYNQFMGYLDKKNKKYIGDESDIVSQIIYGNLSISIMNETTSHSENDNGLIVSEFNYKMLI